MNLYYSRSGIYIVDRPGYIFGNLVVCATHETLIKYVKTTHKPFLLFKPPSFDQLNLYLNERHNMAKYKSVTRLPNI